MNELIEKNEKVEKIIYEIRGVHIILDSDLAKQYKCANGTKTINQAVSRNKEKFPSDFCFQLTDDEYKSLKSQIGTTKRTSMARSLPYAFTEQGVAMLATVIHTKVATEVSINIMRAFVAMRHFIIDNKDIYKSLNNLNNKIIDHDDKINYLFTKFSNNEKVFLPGEIYDAYSNFIYIFKEAKNELIIIDSYADTTLLDIIKKLKCMVVLITKNSDRLNDLDILKYNEQYNNLEVIRNNSFHDRYFIIDRKNIYQSGTSINNAGKKIFSINKMNDICVKKTLLNSAINIINN